jgi:ribosomal protein L7Ae-like RNA K-turn-binding protein
MSNLQGALGMCIKSGNCSYGFENALKSIRAKKCHLILLSKQASESTKKRIFDKCSYYNIDIIELDLKDIKYTLNIDDNVKIITVNDVNFKILIKKQIKGEI